MCQFEDGVVYVRSSKLLRLCQLLYIFVVVLKGLLGPIISSESTGLDTNKKHVLDHVIYSGSKRLCPELLGCVRLC